MPFTVEAVAVIDSSGTMKRTQIERRDPGPRDVVIDLQYTGVCHSDVAHARAQWKGSTEYYPLVPGHEMTGVVARVGSDVTLHRVGDRVGVGVFIDSCRKCKMCLTGNDNYCKDSVVTYNKKPNHEIAYGGYSTAIVVDERYVVAIPQELPMDGAAPLLCAGITMWSPLVHFGALKEGRDQGKGFKVGIQGMGGLGHIGVKLALAMGCQVVAISRGKKKEKAARDMGADFLDMEDAEMRKAHASSFNLILTTASGSQNWEPVFGLMAFNGVVVVLGSPPEDFPMNSRWILFRRLAMVGSAIGSTQEQKDMMEFCARNRVWCDVTVIHPSKLNEAHENLDKGTGGDVSRYVISQVKAGDWEVEPCSSTNPRSWKRLGNVVPPEKDVHAQLERRDRNVRRGILAGVIAAVAGLVGFAVFASRNRKNANKAV